MGRSRRKVELAPEPAPEQVKVESAELLRRVLQKVEEGELTAPAPMVSHLAGALAALEAIEPPS